MRVWAVALNTFKETIRNRVMVNILLFAVALIFISLIVGDWSVYQQVKVLKDFGLAAMSIFGLLIALFIGIRLMVQELEQKTIYIIASKPLHRWEIVLGKYFGLAVTLGANVVLMSVTLGIANLIVEGRIDLGLIPAIILIYLEILLIVAFALFFSTIVSPTLSALFTLAVFVTGHLSGFLRDYVQLYPDRGFHWIFKTIYSVVPNLENLNLKTAVVQGFDHPLRTVLFGFIYGLAYILLLLLVSSIIFEKRDLK